MISDTLLLVSLAFGAGLLNAAFAAGGNILLVLGMTGFFPAPAVIPIHGTTALFSHVFRALLDTRSIQWKVAAQIMAGTFIAIAAVTPIVPLVPAHYLPLILGTTILVAIWIPHVHPSKLLPIPFFFCGLIQGAATMFVGATGPILMLFFLDAGLNKDEIVATMGLSMIVTELLKMSSFLIMGFDFFPYLHIIGWMGAGILAGTLAGRYIRHHCPDGRFRIIVKWIITAMALRLLLA